MRPSFNDGNFTSSKRFINSKNLEIMRKAVMLLAVLLGTSFMVNANTINKKPGTTKEVRADRHKKHRKVKKAATNAEAVKPTAKVEK